MLIFILFILPAFAFCEQVIVDKYVLSIHLEDSFLYEGNVNITFRTLMAPKTITLHSKGLTILSSKITVDNAFNFEHSLEQTEGEIIIKGIIPFHDIYHFKLDLSFTGRVSDGLSGFYRGEYKDENGLLWAYATTQFHSIGARSAFPCFDEPHFRSPFQLSFTVGNNWSVISNTKVAEEQLKGTWKTVKFLETPSMPTYLLAWLIYDMRSFKEIQKKSGVVSYSVYAQSHLKEEGSFSISIMPQVISKFENYTGVPYKNGNLNKLDCLALPDLSPAAMENYGLVTYKDYRLLHNNITDTAEELQHTMLVVAHELAHQWFGNLITATSWSHVWLNEGFARYFEFIASKMINPDWRLEEQFVTDVMQVAMEFDVPYGFAPTSYETPLSGYEIKTENDIDFMFNPITYHKGASFLRMTSWLIGDEVFKQRINNYLNNCMKQSGHATPEIFLESLSGNHSNINGLPILYDMMEKWTTLVGFPVVHARRIGNNIALHQTIYGRTSEEFDTWQIPIPIAEENSRPDQISLFWIGGNFAPSVNMGEIGKWYLINPNQTGYYHVNYDEENWKALKNNIWTSPILNPLTRSMLINDAVSLMISQDLKSEIAMDFIDYLIDETDLIPWKTALRKFRGISTALMRSKNLETWKEYVRNLTHNIINSTDFESTSNSHTGKIFQKLLLQHACYYDHPICNATINKYFINGTLIPSISPEIMAATMCSLIKNGNNQTWHLFYEKYLSSKIPGEKIKILHSLGCSNDKDNLKKLLTTSLHKDIVNKSHFLNLLMSLADNPVGADELHLFLIEHEKEIIKHAGNSTGTIFKLYKKVLETADMHIIEKIENYLTTNFKTEQNKFEKNIADAKKYLTRKTLIETQVCQNLKCLHQVNQSPRSVFGIGYYLIIFVLVFTFY